MGVLAPAGALADQLDLGRALANQHRLEQRRERGDRGAGDLAQRGALVAEDAGVAVLVGADRAAEPHVREHRRQQAHRVHEARVLGVALDAREVGLGADALDLELRHERHQLAGRVGGEGDGPLGGEETPVRQVPDVALVEDHVAA